MTVVPRLQLDLPFAGGAPAGAANEPGQPDVPQAVVPRALPPAGDPEVVFVRMRRARRYVLRVRAGGVLRVTIPRGGSRREAAQFVEKHAEWIRTERARLAAAAAAQWVPGGSVLLRGEPMPLAVAPAPAGLEVCYGERTVRLPGGVAGLRRAIEGDLRRLARSELGPRLAALAAQHGLTVSGVSIRNQRSRWGSCSREGRIALNFRLIQMPPEVCDYVLLHELMHLKEQNHSRRFWRLVAAVCPGFRQAEFWLKTEGRALFC